MLEKEAIMSQEAITRVGYGRINNMIDEYNNIIFADLGHIDREGNRVSDIIISSNGLVNIKKPVSSNSSRVCK